jgi:DNA-binding NarL/FixJ family response regulator
MRIVATNREFDRQADQHRAFRVDPTGHLSMPRATDQKRFFELVNDALCHGRHGARPRKEALALKSSGGIEVLCVEVVPLSHVEEIGSKNFDGAIVYSHDTSQPIQCDTAVVRLAFGFTETEGALIDAICNGLTNKEIADRRGRSQLTVSTQVKSILAKSQCANRTQLVRMMMQFGGNFLVQ